jgi:NADPH:quinone reductase-like Zn-dependent oxidoreductase
MRQQTGFPMRTIIHDRFGDPADVLTIGERPLPEPGPGEVRVKTLLSPIHNHDLWTIRGNYGYKPELPAIGGSEAVGIVDALGDGVTGVEVGQRVAVAGVRGSWAEAFTAPAAGLVPVPDALPDEAAAQLVAMPFSAITLLEFLEVEPGDWIIQNAANGAVGKVLAKLAAARGVNVVSLVRRAAGVAEMAAHGIENVVATDSEGWPDQVREIVGDSAIRAGVDSIGGTASGDMMALLGEGGTLVSFGSATGAPMQIASGDVIFKQAVVKGFWGTKVAAATSPEDKARLMTELVTALLTGALTLPVDGVFGFDAAADAVRATLTPGKAGKVLLKP